MKVTVKDIDQHHYGDVAVFENVDSVEQGICDMVLISIGNQKILFPVSKKQYFVIDDDAKAD